MLKESSAGGPIDLAKLRERISHQERMTRRSHFSDVYGHGDSVHGEHVVLFCLRRTDAGTRVGFVAGRKVGGAVQRNRARRCLREAWRRIQRDVPRDTWFVCVARRGAAECRTGDLEREMRGLLVRVPVVSP